MGRRFVFSVLNDDADKKDSDTGQLQRKCVILKREGETETFVGRHSILALRMTVTRLGKMANIKGMFILNQMKDSEKNYSQND